MKILGTALLAFSLSCSPLIGVCKNKCHECQLTDGEREMIWREIQFAIKKLHGALDRADKEARKITDVDIESATRGAIAGAFAGIQSNNPFGMTISSCLGAMGMIAGDSYIHFRRSKAHVQDAAYYAYHADELQERLWRNQ